jgi:hypothetical protein
MMGIQRNAIIVIVIAIVILIAGGFWIISGLMDFSCDKNISQKDVELTPKTYTPNLTRSDAQGIVYSAIKASTPAIQQSAGWMGAEFNTSTRQWHVTVWKSEEDSKKYGGAVYIVDDATGKLLNPPPVYYPK